MFSLLSDLKVIQRDPDTGVISYGLGTVPQIVTGIDKLVQVFIYALMNVAGRDVLEPGKGAGLMEMIGQYNVDVDDKTSLMDMLYTKLDKASEDVKAGQAGLVNEDPNSMLNTFRMINVADSADFDSINLKLRLISMAGTQVDISV